MNFPPRSHRWVATLATCVAVAVVAACDAPTATDVSNPALVVAAAKKAQPTVQTCSQCAVEVNVKHGNDQAKINLKGIANGNGSSASLTVSVLGSSDFDLSAVDLASLRIGDATTTPVTPVEELKHKYQASIVDLNGDGILDLMLHFSIQQMVDLGNLSATTTSLCLVGEGPGYTIAGCGAVTVSGDADGGSGGSGGFSVVEVVPWGDAGADKAVWATLIKYWKVPEALFPDWTTVDLTDLAAQGAPWNQWRQAVMPIASESGSAVPPVTDPSFLTSCGVTPSAFFWAPTETLLMRTDVQISPDASSVTLEFLVDNYASVFVNGVEVTNGFSTNQKPGQCPNAARPVSVSVPTSLLSPDGNNEVAVWALDLGYAGYFDLHITAKIAN